jgi:hypothetical protein
MLFALIWLLGLSALSLGCVYYFLTHDSGSRSDGQARADRQTGEARE